MLTMQTKLCPMLDFLCANATTEWRMQQICSDFYMLDDGCSYGVWSGDAMEFENAPSRPAPELHVGCFVLHWPSVLVI